jgi:predicted TPR repeat methyltransferase
VQAREICRLGTHLDPKSLGALFELAKMQRKTDQPDEAARTYRRILAIEPDNAFATKSLSEM